MGKSSYKKPSTVSRDRRDMTHYSSKVSSHLVHQPDIAQNFIGVEAPYEKHLQPKWKHNATIDAKPSNEKPYINRRSLYH